ncbi:nuclear transport factor 2 family protein [Hymenobacter sp. BT175]|uniref:YybH family protein n=1 Tax=Hymenobacter translucens TaxID=2886507 RepID=UPI001D0E0BD7|nr:nuclear transport factor 2 family protein [Hymenobacter translucens]MCC2547366.1 nuclear transport factor 2 family protein [Hymenobacter translucens]
MKSYMGILLVAASLTACSRTSDTDTGAVNVHDLNQQFIGAWNTKDGTKLDSLLADDVQFVQGETHFSGKSEVGSKWVRATLGTITDLKTNVVSTGTDANLAYEAGTFSVDVLPTGPDMPHGIGEGNFILLWKKNPKGTWKLSYAQLEDLPVHARGQ